MSEQRSFQVAGVDGCKGGWLIAIACASKTGSRINPVCNFELKRFLLVKTFADVLSETSNCKLVCIDIPIGLSDGSKPRQCDMAARKVLRSKRASSVFPAPIRACLSAKDYKTASQINFERCGKKLNKQSFFLLEKICQVDDLMTPLLQRRVREIHPEISFWALNGQKPIEQGKKNVLGQAQRHKLLQQIFPDIDGFLVKLPKSACAMDDALDAIIAAWTAGQAVIGKAKTLPEKPPLDSKSLKMEMLYPVCYNQ